jgi:hypothetical protein
MTEGQSLMGSAFLVPAPPDSSKVIKSGGSGAEPPRDNLPVSYRLVTDIFGIGFLTADRIAEKLGFAKDSELRAEAGILYVLHQLADDGHVYYPLQPLIDECRKILEVEPEILVKALSSLSTNQNIVIESLQPGPKSRSEMRRTRCIWRCCMKRSRSNAR